MSSGIRGCRFGVRGIGPRVQDIQILKMYSQSSSILKDVLMISFQVMHYIMRDFDNFFSPTCKSLYLSRPSETIQATWFLDNVEVWYNLISYFFVPATHQGFCHNLCTATVHRCPTTAHGPFPWCMDLFRSWDRVHSHWSHDFPSCI